MKMFFFTIVTTERSLQEILLPNYFFTPLHMLDLHFHSTRSDGLKTPEEIIALGNTGDILTCTDHDFVNDEFTTLARTKGIQTCQSVEISAYDPRTPDKIQLHITYYAAKVNTLLRDHLERVREVKVERIRDQIERLRSNGFTIDLEGFYDYFQNKGASIKNLSSAHIAEYLFLFPENISQVRVLTGENLESMDFIYECLKLSGRFPWIGTGKKDLRAECNIDIQKVLEYAAMDKAITSIAHPNFSLKTFERYHELVPKYLEMGLRAVEINSAATKEWVQEILASQQAHGHALTFGSDCHFKKETDNKHNILGVQNITLEETFIETETRKTLDGILS